MSNAADAAMNQQGQQIVAPSVWTDSACMRRAENLEYRNLYGDGWAMKTTLDLNDTLLTEAKALAAQQRTTLTRLIEEGLQLRLRKQRAQAKPLRMPVYRGKGGLMPGLDSLSNKALLDVADRDA